MGIAKYWINLEEFLEAFQKDLESSILSAIRNQVQAPFVNCEDLIRIIEQTLPDKYYVKLISKIKKLIQNQYSGTPHILGVKSYIPPLKGDFDTTWVVPESCIHLMGLQIETTGWKIEDSYSLKVKHYTRGLSGKVIKTQVIELFKNIPFKESGEHKSFRIFYNYFGSRKIKKGDELVLVFHNNSGNSRQLFLDYEYLSGTAPEIIPMGDTAFFLDTTGSMYPQLQPGSLFYSKLPQYLMDIGANGDVVYTYFFGDTYNNTYEYKYCGSKSAEQTVKFFGDPSNIYMFSGAGHAEIGLDIVYKKYSSYKNLGNIFIATDCDNITDKIIEQWQKIRDKGINIFLYIPRENIEIYRPLEDLDLLKVIGTF